MITHEAHCIQTKAARSTKAHTGHDNIPEPAAIGVATTSHDSNAHVLDSNRCFVGTSAAVSLRGI